MKNQVAFKVSRVYPEKPLLKQKSVRDIQVLLEFANFYR